ncbi:TPA: recombinase RecT [Streptococcus pneumoniae]
MTNNQLATQTKRNITTDPSLLTGADIKKYFDPQNLLTEKQVGQALALCKGRNLNPFANEVYKGAIMLPEDTLIGGWARVHRKNFKVPVEIFVSREEYDKKQSTWNTMPATMIRKVALVNALREAFPEDLGNMYTEDDGGETFDRIKDVTPQESREDVVARKMAQIDQFNKEQEANHADPEPTQNEDPIQGELLDGELEY